MGLKGAGAWFHYLITSIVLAGLVYISCEGYLDDVIVHAHTEDELLTRLREVFERFRQYEITLNPDKCISGLTEIEFVGHVIDSTGLRFTDNKLDGIREFALPRTKKTLKSFLGLANFFRDHVKNHSMLAKPLQDLVEGYDRKSRNHVVKWTEIGLNAFRDLKEAVAKCQKLYFLDYEKEIFLQTDASDYGVGAYLFQKKEDESHHPVMFISKSFNKVQLRWSVPEKEGYAIHLALNKMEHLLRDTPFILETDHQNLTRIYSSGSPKVLMAIRISKLQLSDKAY